LSDMPQQTGVCFGPQRCCFVYGFWLDIPVPKLP
jgi:hypothetical protein